MFLVIMLALLSKYFQNWNLSHNLTAILLDKSMLMDISIFDFYTHNILLSTKKKE